ncbi:MAG: hypothetical protein CV087_04680 [Candidatus Brocadia sp. WS118]|nr:MAG: hypothetical protein CV087_04680 [Candidatus Brocadia sp. WS118]
MYPSKLRNKEWFIIGSFATGVSILFVMVTWNTKNARQTAPVHEIKPGELTPFEHLTEARKALADGYKPGEDQLKTSWGRVYDARIHLGAVQNDSPEYAEAQRLMDEVKQREAEMGRVSEVLTQICLKKRREEVAGKLEKYFMDKEMYVAVKLEGEEETILRLEYIFWSRPLVYRVVNGTGLLPALKNIGYLKVIFDATHDYSWTYDLEGGSGE